VAVGAPISTALLGLDGLFGLEGWQVMYIAEAIPTLVIGVITFFLLTDRPEQAKFLTAEERNWLVTRIASERRATEAVRTFTLWQALYNPKVLLLALNYLGIVTASLGMLIFIPQIIKSLGGYSNMTVGWLTMIPYICGAVAMVAWGRISDRMNERRWNLFIACVFGGFFGPWYVGVMKDLTGSYAGGLYGLALLGLVAAIVCALFLHIPSRTSLAAAPPIGAAAE
jgi:MFS transporter, ACS family, tartrate transporter